MLLTFIHLTVNRELKIIRPTREEDLLADRVAARIKLIRLSNTVIPSSGL